MANNIRQVASEGSNLFLLKQLVHVRLLGDLKKSFLGWVWLIILPLITILIWILIKNAGVIRPGKLGVPYTAFVILSTTVWFSFYEIYKSCSQLFVNYGKVLLVNKLPIFILVLSELLVAIVKFLVPASMMIVFFLITDIPIHFMSLFAFAIYLCLMLLGASIGLFVSLFSSISKDFTFLADNSMRLLMFVTPVVYSSESVLGLLARILDLNILTFFFEGIRGYFFFGEYDRMQILTISCGLIIILFAAVARFFIINTPRILERGEI